MRRAAEIIILFSTTTLFYRRDVFYLFKPFEIGILAAILCTLAYILNAKRNIFKEIPNLPLWLTLFALMFLFSAVGTANGYRIYGMADPVKTAGGFFYLGIGIVAFLLTLYYGRSARFRNAIILSFASSLIFAPFIFIPELAEKAGFITERIYFQGLHKNPTTFAFLASIAAIALVGRYFRTNRNLLKAAYATGTISMLTLCLWTGSRATLLSITVSFAWIAFHSRLFGVRKFAVLLAAVLATTVAFAILPHRAQIMILDRVYPQISGTGPNPTRFDKIPLKTAFGFLIAGMPSLPYQSRQSLWPQSINLFVAHPSGLGMEYFRSAQAIRQNGLVTHSHNTVLQVLLTGGVGLFITCVFFLFTILKKINHSKKDAEWLVITTMLVCSAAFLIIGEYFYITPWIWIIAALASAKADDTRDASAV